MIASDDLQLETEIDLLLEAIFHRYHYDFRRYARGSLRRRVAHAVTVFSLPDVAALRQQVVGDATAFARLLRYLTVQVSDMFRDPPYWRALREQVLPLLATYPSLKVWIAGASTGEEVYSMAICLHELGLLQRTLIYATDIHAESQEKARAGIYDLDRVARFSTSYRDAGGTGSLADYYTAAYGSAVMDKKLQERVVFSDHSLATDSVFTEVHLVSCRNVLIYFAADLQQRALGLFRESLCPQGFLGLGARESLRFLDVDGAFVVVDEDARIYRKRPGAR